jgi:hypothetical protein
MWRWHDTYHWKPLDKGYNLASNLTLIGGLHTKLWASKVTKVSISRISRFQLRSPWTKWHLGVGPVARHKEYYKGARWWFPPSLNHGESWESMYALVRLAPKMFQLRTNQLVIWFVQVRVNNWFACHSSQSPSWSFSTLFYFKVLWARECGPTPYPSTVFTFWIRSWVH